MIANQEKKRLFFGGKTNEQSPKNSNKNRLLQLRNRLQLQHKNNPLEYGDNNFRLKRLIINKNTQSGVINTRKKINDRKTFRNLINLFCLEKMTETLQDSNPYCVEFPETDIEKIRNTFDNSLKDSIKAKLKKVIEDVREDIETEYYTQFSDNLESYLNQLATNKAKALVHGLLRGEEQALKVFLRYDSISREKVLESVIGYAAQIELEELKRDNSRLREHLELTRNRY